MLRAESNACEFDWAATQMSKSRLGVEPFTMRLPCHPGRQTFQLQIQMNRTMRSVLLPLVLALLVVACIPQPSSAVQDGQPKVTQGDIENLMASKEPSGNSAPGPRLGIGGMNFLQLLIDGGALMIPIGLMSLLVLAIGVERWIALRSSKIFPRRLRREIRRAADDELQVSPAELYRTAELFPSSASRVLKDLITKIGRPIPEAEATITESVQHEADRLYNNVRWLTLAAAVTPLIGLLGTVWGMIIAFYNTTQLTSGSNRVESLAEGIYVALVTTLAGLTVAIPAAILAHYFEGKITKNLATVDVEMRHLTPRFEQFEGKLRFDVGPRGITSRPIASHATTPLHASSSASSPEAPPVHSSARPPKLKA